MGSLANQIAATRKRNKTDLNRSYWAIIERAADAGRVSPQDVRELADVADALGYENEQPERDMGELENLALRQQEFGAAESESQKYATLRELGEELDATDAEILAAIAPLLERKRELKGQRDKRAAADRALKDAKQRRDNQAKSIEARKH